MTAWISKPLGELCQLINGRAFKPSDWSITGLPIVRIQNLNDPSKPLNCFDGGVKDQHRIDSGDLLLSWSGTPGTSFGCFIWSRGPAVLNQHIFKVRVDQETLDSEFFMFAMNSKLDEMIALAHGGVGLRHITKEKLETIELPLPPLVEQRRIVARIKACMERIDEITRLREAVSREAGAVMPSSLHALFMELAVAQPIERLGDVTDILGGQSLPEGTPVDPGSGAIMLFKVADMNLPGNEVHAATARAYLSPPVRGRVVPPGAVILPKRGGAIATNKKRLLSRPSLLDPNLMAVVPHDDRLRSAYLLAWFETFDLQQLATGGVVPQLNKQDLAPLDIPVPTLAKQDELIEGIERIRVSSRALVATYQEAIAETNQLAQAVLRKAFAGEL